MTSKTPITVAHGDGIGPEIMEATLHILNEAGAALDIETIKIGKEVYESGVPTGIEESSWASLQRTKVFLKAPITTPQGGGFKSLNVTIRKSFGLFANVRPCVSYHPFVRTMHPDMDIVIVRENEEDLYGGIEYRLTQNSMQSIKLITRQGSERIARYGFEYARAYGRKKVTCMSKDNIMKIADGLFHKVFDEVASEYPDIESDHMIIDIGTAKIAANPQMFDVVVTPNLYGDIISDVAAEVTGSVGLGGSANIGMNCAMFEAVHGSAPDIAGKGIANPSGLLLGAVMMLVHIGQNEAAALVHNAWLKTIEDGIHTGDIYQEGKSKERANTKSFTDAVIARLGQKPETLAAVDYSSAKAGGIQISDAKIPEAQTKKLVGVDIFVECDGDPNALASRVQESSNDNLSLETIANRGVKVWPNPVPGTLYSDLWRLRFIANSDTDLTSTLALATVLAGKGFDIVKTENLYDYESEKGYSV